MSVFGVWPVEERAVNNVKPLRAGLLPMDGGAANRDGRAVTDCRGACKIARLMPMHLPPWRSSAGITSTRAARACVLEQGKQGEAERAHYAALRRGSAKAFGIH